MGCTSRLLKTLFFDSLLQYREVLAKSKNAKSLILEEKQKSHFLLFVIEKGRTTFFNRLLDHQAQDAKALLFNNKHQVTRPLTEEEMVMLEAQGNHAIGKLSIYAALVVLGIIGFIPFLGN